MAGASSRREASAASSCCAGGRAVTSKSSSPPPAPPTPPHPAPPSPPFSSPPPPPPQHEYDYRYASPNDPSGASGGVHRDMPAWFDGDVDSRGECGVGTERRFRAPAGPGSNKIFWYAFSSGSVAVISLSSEHSGAPGSPQRAFLEGALAAANRSATPWLVVTFHREVYSLTGDEQPLQDGYLAWYEDLLYAARVDLVVNGHIHQSQRTVPVYKYARTPDAPVYVISGSAGAMLEPYPADNSTGLVAFNGLGACGFYVADAANATHLRLTWTRNNDSAVLDDAWVVRDAARGRA